LVLPLVRWWCCCSCLFLRQWATASLTAVVAVVVVVGAVVAVAAVTAAMAVVAVVVVAVVAGAFDGGLRRHPLMEATQQPAGAQ
jgi:hypothetical protein